MTIKIEFPADRMDIAKAMGQALLDIAEGVEGPIEAPKPKIPLDWGESSSAGTAADVDEEEEDSKEMTSDSRVDAHGVEFNPKYCANAKDPFYNSGKQLGQWKKARGVDQADYDVWYESAKPALAAEAEDKPVDAAAAFSGQPQQQAAKPQLANPGEFFGWVSELQAAGKLNQGHIDKAYSELGVSMGDLFSQPPEQLSQTLISLQNKLTAMVQ